MMVVTGRGRQKLVIQDILDKAEQIELARRRRDTEGVTILSNELCRMVLTGVQTGDFQGLTAKTVARIALNTITLTRS